jgi:O-antigen ligase
MRFFLFILANAMLFIRPSELLPGLGDVELYRYVIVACMLVSVPVVVQQVFERAPGVPPVVGCVIGLFPAVLLSHISHGNGEEALEQGIEFFKVLLYFLLLIGLVTTMAQLKRLLHWLCVFAAILTLVAVLRYHTDLAKPETIEQPVTVDATSASGKPPKLNGTSVIEKVRDPNTDELVDIPRMCGTGIFNDPNDLALVLITSIPICLYWLTDPRRKAARPLWIGLILLFGYALMLTHSRGGLLALLAGLGVLLHMRFGGAKTVMFGALLLPALLAVFAGRMTSISASEGTGQSRIQLWSDGLLYFRQAPLFGIGMDNYHSVSAHVAHNSYIHCYAELGIFGGTLFVGAFYFAVHGLYRLRSKPAEPPESADANLDVLLAEPRPPADPEVERLHPYLMAMIVAYAVGIAFLSRTYIVPTYLLLGLAVVYMRLRSTGVMPKWCRLAMGQLAGVSICFLVGAYVFVRALVSWH